MEDEDVIREQMEETRTSLTDKLETLEQQVVGTAQAATSAVTDTVEAVKETVQEAVASVQETVANVKETVQETVCAVKGSMEEGVAKVKGLVDIPAHVDSHPWLMTAGSVALGFILGRFLAKQSPPPQQPLAAGLAKSHASPNGGLRDEKKSPNGAGGFSLLDTFGPEIAQLRGIALGALMGTVREMIVKSVPEQFAGQLKEMMDNVTEKIGGKPVADMNWGSCHKQDHSHKGGEHHAESNETKMGGSLGPAHREDQETVGHGNR